MKYIVGDCRVVLATLPAESFDACVTDPPYHLTAGKKGGTGPASASAKTPHGRARITAGFMGKAWDGGDVAMQPATWEAVLRVLKPGAYLLAFGGTRTFHRMAVAIEDAGFEIRDTLMWMYGTGFPKSHDVSKGVDKHLGSKGTFGEPKSAAHAGWIERGRMRGDDNEEGWQRPWMADPEAVDNAARKYIPATPEAAEWQGWGTALKPAWEPIIVARKPLIGTVAENVLQHGTGALNIDGCRIGTETVRSNHTAMLAHGGENARPWHQGHQPTTHENVGRWPANVVHDGSDEVLEAFAAYGEKGGGDKRTGNSGRRPGGFGGVGSAAGDSEPNAAVYADTGSAARFFYSAKATKADRAGSSHPTVKPIALMRYLCRLVTPPGGTVLDPFAGSGTTGEAALREGFQPTLIEAEPEYVEDIKRRLLAAQRDMLPAAFRGLL